MIFINVISIILLLLLITSTSITDIRNSIIPNKILLVSLVISVIVNMIYFILIEHDTLILYILNLSITIIVSILFYLFHIWSAGDSKLIIVLISILPTSLYSQNYNTALLIFIYVFSIGFGYLIIESIILFVKDKNKLSFTKTKIPVVKFIKRYFTIVAIISTITQAIYYVIPTFYNDNRLLFSFINLFIILLLQNNKWIKNNILSIILIFLWILTFVFSLNKFIINWNSYIIFAIVILLRGFTEQYNYKMIITSSIKKGMILSYHTIISFQNSRIKGLPKSTTEDLCSKLTEEEVDSILRWEKSINGKDKITIVRKIPFAVIISSGILLYIIIEVLLYL